MRSLTMVPICFCPSATCSADPATGLTCMFLVWVFVFLLFNGGGFASLLVQTHIYLSFTLLFPQHRDTHRGLAAAEAQVTVARATEPRAKPGNREGSVSLPYLIPGSWMTTSGC